ncbi:MAG: peptidylprolyl isomerase [Candidatus Bathyarchaeia archaeon]
MGDRQARLRRIQAKRARAFRKKVVTIALFIVLVVVIAAAYIWATQQQPPVARAGKVLFVTSMGNITIELFDEQPITTANFKNLTNLGIYDDTIFHRVMSGFMIQGGDPTGTGYGHPDIAMIPDEFNGDQRNLRGTVAMANQGQPNTGSSQFFINLVYNDHLDYDKEPLDYAHPVFGRVVEGMDVVDAISNVEVDDNNKPLVDVWLIKAIVIP